MEPLKIVKYYECSQKERELLLKRSEVDTDSAVIKAIKIISDVRREGDKALVDYTEKFDGVKIEQDSIKVSEGEFRLAKSKVDPKVFQAIQILAKSIEKFHRRQLPGEWTMELAPGVKAGQIVRPLEKVGIYVPGGIARYPSTLLMAAIPAKVAGVKRIVVCTPPASDGKIAPAVLVAANVAGVEEVFKVGGAQAIGAMAYGTETVPKVDKIVGPGNVYVAAAKQVVAPNVDIDFSAGPSEVLIIADDSANPEIIASDLVAQAEHDTEAAAMLVTTSEKLANEVREAARLMVKENARWQITLRALTKYGKIVVFKTMGEAVDFANAYAPEHLEIMAKEPRKLLESIENAGSIFLGEYSPVAAGDLGVGVNHILPTGGAARRTSGLSVLDFVKLPTIQEISKSGLKEMAKTIQTLAEVEGLPAHSQSVKKRTEG